MNKGLEAYEIVKEECGYAFGQTANGDRVRKSLPIIETELKALEIIRNKQVNIFLFKECYKNKWKMPYSYNQSHNKRRQLTEEENDLLKEVLL